jgi:hypothetical protein
MVEVDARLALADPNGRVTRLDARGVRRRLIAYYAN